MNPNGCSDSLFNITDEELAYLQDPCDRVHALASDADEHEPPAHHGAAKLQGKFKDACRQS